MRASLAVTKFPAQQNRETLGSKECPSSILMTLVLEPHDPRWADMFDTESKMVIRALGSNVTAIHHIGSTAIPDIYAKPIIDMLIEVVDIAEVDAHNLAMKALGYEAMGEYGIGGRRYFRKENDAGIRTHHAHTFATGSPEILRPLAFRDFMLEHPKWAERYSDLKRELAKAHSDSVEHYIDGKDGFIKDVDRRAAAWRAGSSA